MPTCKGATTRREIAWVLFVSIACAIKWDSSRTATATAFSLASIFPRRTEKGHIRNSEVIVKPVNDLATATPVYRDVEEELLEDMKSNVYISESSMPTMDPEHSHYLQDEAVNGNSGDESVHLQLKMMHDARPASENTVVDCVDDTSTELSTEDETAQQQQQHPKTTRVCSHTYVDPTTNRTWVGLNTSRRKFLAFLEYNNITLVDGRSDIYTSTVILPESGGGTSALADAGDTDDQAKLIAEGEEERHLWRQLWKKRQLITDRTELLAVYQSDNDEDSSNDNNPRSIKKGKRGGFRDLLDLYANRLVAILQDEQHDERTPPDVRYRSSLVRSHQRNRYGQPLMMDDNNCKNDHRILVKWLEDNYGMSETLMLQARRFRTLPVPAQLELMHHFLDWFRGCFPYYYDRCDACGASQKDDLAAQLQDAQSAEEAVDIMGEEDEDDDQSTFLGYIYTDQYEEVGKASRTELYHCHKCGSFTRFPRYNSAFDIIQSRRGRCGEYSLLLFRMLRALGHDTRWVVDWADHVWAEVLIGSTDNEGTTGQDSGGSSRDTTTERWVHLDPCEAAVDKPLLYEEWGKKQTYIIALYAPLRYQAIQLQNRHNGFLGNLRILNNGSRESYRDVAKASLVEDVTQLYTTDSWENICKRREEMDEEVKSAIDDAIEDLERKLFR